MRIPMLMLLAAGLAASHASAQLYKCVNNGKVVYQDSPCDQGANQSTVRPPHPTSAPAPASESAPAAAPAAGGAEPTPGVDVEAVVTVLSGFQTCANDLGGYAAKHNAAYNGWRTRNQASIARYNQDPEAQRRVRSNLEDGLKDRPRDAQGIAGRTESCDSDAERWFSTRPRPPQ